MGRCSHQYQGNWVLALDCEPGDLGQHCVTFAISLSLQNLLELEVDLDNLELEDIDTTDINLDEDILDD